MKKTRLLALLLAVVLCVGLLPVSASAVDASITWVDGVDADGDLTETAFNRNGVAAEDSGSTTLREQFYIVEANSDVTITGDLTLDRSATIILCSNSKLTVTGSLKVTGEGACIYGQTSTHQAKDAGKLIVQNTVDAGAAVRSTGIGLSIYGGSVELHGGANEQITDNAGLFSQNKITKGTLDGEAAALSAWSGVSSLPGSKLVLEYCKHDDEDTAYMYDGEDTNTHHLHCNACGLDYGSESCNFDSGDVVNAGADGHYRTCWCGNQESTITEHTLISVPTRDGQGHTSGCQYCDYMSGSFGDPHNWIYDENGKNTGECKDCGFSPVAADDYANLYGSVEDALKAATEGYKIKLYTVKDYAEGEEKAIYESVTFNAPGKTAELDMNGYTLKSSSTVLTVEAGTLTLTNEKESDNSINIVQYGTNETAAPAIEVTGGKLIVNGDLYAEGGFSGSGIRQPAIKATGGELELNGSLNLKGGLTLKEPAKLNTPLKQGVFWAENNETLTYRIDLRGNNASKPANHPDLESLLETGYVFVMSDTSGNPITDTDGNYSFYSPASNLVGANVTIVAHEHSYHQLTNSVAKSVHACDCGKSEDHKFVNGECTVCSYVCKHDDVHLEEDNTFQCARCKMTMVAKSETGGTTTYYSDLVAALAGAADGATVTLLADVKNDGKYAIVTGDSTTVTLDLNGHTISGGWMQVGIDRNWNDQTSTTLKVVGSGSINTSGNLSVGYYATLDLSGWTGKDSTISHVSLAKNGKITPNPESLLIVSENIGTIGELGFYSWPAAGVKTKLNGGIYGSISIVVQYNSEPFGSLLAPGYAFQYVSTGEYENYNRLATNQGNTINNVKVVRCPHGALTTDADGTLRCGYCNEDMSVYVVEITCKNGSIGYTSDPSDGFLNDEDVVKVKLLKDFNSAGNEITVDHAMTVDLNGKTIGELTVRAAGVQIIDSAATKGSIGTLNVTAGGVTVRDLLEDGYGFKSTDGTWVAEGAVTASNVSIAEAPIKDVYFFEGEEKITALTKVYGEERTLYAIHNSRDDVKSLTQTMYLVKDDGSLEKVGSSWACKLSQAQYAGTYTYRITATADGYSKSADITVTVEPADLKTANVEVDLAGGGEIMFTPDWKTGAGTEVTMRVVNVRVNGITLKDEDYEVLHNKATNAGDWRLTIKAVDGSKKITGSRGVDWKVTPFTLGYFHLPWGIEKNYDGTTALPENWFTGSFAHNNRYYEGPNAITLISSLYTCSANYTDANVGENKTIDLALSLKSDNYRFESNLEGVSDDAKSLSLTSWTRDAVNFKINKINLPVTPSTGSAAITNGVVKSYTVQLSLPALPDPMQYGTVVTYGAPTFAAEGLASGESYDISATVDENGILTLNVLGTTGSKTGKIGTVTIPVTTTNFNPFELTVEVNAEAEPHTGYSDQVKKQSEEFEAKKRGELPETDSTFTDVDEDDYFFDAVEWAAENGITGGVSANRFAPGLDCTRGQTMTFLWRAMGEPEPESYDSALTDVKPGGYYYDAVLWAMEEGVTTGMGKNLFAPDATVTRGQFVTFLYRLSGEKSSAEHPFTDVPAGSYYEPAIAWAYSKGITTGTSKTAFNPDAPCTRAQIITFLYRYFNQK